MYLYNTYKHNKTLMFAQCENSFLPFTGINAVV